MIELNDLKKFLAIDSNEHDAMLNREIANAVSYLQSMINRKIIFGKKIENNSCFLKGFPIKLIAAEYLSGSSYLNMYEGDLNQSIIMYSDGVLLFLKPIPDAQYRIIYYGGFFNKTLSGLSAESGSVEVTGNFSNSMINEGDRLIISSEERYVSIIESGSKIIIDQPFRFILSNAVLRHTNLPADLETAIIKIAANNFLSSSERNESTGLDYKSFDTAFFDDNVELARNTYPVRLKFKSYIESDEFKELISKYRIINI